MAPFLQPAASDRARAEEDALGPRDHDASPNGHPLNDDGIDQLLDDLRSPLTLIRGSSQILLRRARRDNTVNTDYLIARLAIIERSTRDIEARLQDMEHRRRGR